MIKSFRNTLRRLHIKIVCQIHGFSSKMIFIVFFICIPLVISVSHTLITTYTGKNGQTVAGSAVTKLDGLQIDYYDSEIKKLIPKQDWMKEFAATETCKEYTEIREHVQQINKLNIPDLMQRFSQTGGDDTYQRVYGCVWDDETGDSSGFDEYSYDGQDFISLDLKEIRYTASVPQAEPTVEKWNEDREWLAYLKLYYRYECVYWLKELLYFSKDFFEKTGKVPTFPGQSLTEPTKKTVNDNKSDGSASFLSYIMLTVIILVILIMIALCVLRKTWNRTIKYFNKVRYCKVYSTPQKKSSTEDCSQSQQSHISLEMLASSPEKESSSPEKESSSKKESSSPEKESSSKKESSSPEKESSSKKDSSSPEEGSSQPYPTRDI